MDTSKQKVVQYLNEAHASELALVRVLQSQIAMTPRGTYRSALESHLRETRSHANRVSNRLGALGLGANPVMAVVGLAETIMGQVIALSKTPLDLLRGTGGEEKVLKNAKDAAATEALEIATYTAIERLARAVGDQPTAELAASILADEERMLATILAEIPELTDAVVKAEVTGRVPAPASADDLPISGYDARTASDIVARLGALSAVDVTRIATYERAHKNRAGVLKATERVRATA